MEDSADALDLESFAASVGLDERATQALAELPPQSQFVVMHLVKQQSCRNPSAVTWSKVKAMRETPMQVKAEYLRQELDDPSYAALAALPINMQEHIVSEVDVLRSRNLSAVVWAKLRALGVAQPSGGPQVGGQAVTEKMEALQLDEAAQEALGKLTRAEQIEVLNRVNPEACRNPSAVVIARIQDLRKNGLGRGAPAAAPLARLPAPQLPGGMPPGFATLAAGLAGAGRARERSRTPVPAANGLHPSMAMQVLRTAAAGGGPHAGAAATAAASLGAYSIQGQLDERAQRAVAELGPQDQHMVMALVGQENCKNPSAVAWSKVKKVKENPSEVKMEFLRKSIDEGASKALSELPAELQEMIITDIDVTKCRNLSAVIWSKVKGASGGVMPQSQRPQPKPVRTQEVEFGADDGLQLDSRAREALGSISPEDQARIVAEVESQPGIKNPSAFVWSKIKKLREGMS